MNIKKGLNHHILKEKAEKTLKKKPKLRLETQISGIFFNNIEIESPTIISTKHKQEIPTGILTPKRNLKRKSIIFEFFFKFYLFLIILILKINKDGRITMKFLKENIRQEQLLNLKISLIQIWNVLL